MNKKIAILVPTYPPHFWRAYDLLKSFKKYGFDKQADLHFCFTNEEEADKFGSYKNKIILPEKYRIFENKGIINIKKFYAIFSLKDNYEYILVLDDESLFIKKENLFNICNEFYNHKILYGNTVIFNPQTQKSIMEIQSHCKAFYQNEIQKKLSTYDNLYLWFNNLCIYKTDLLEDFNQKTQIFNNIEKLHYRDFDYYVFMYYLIAYQNFSVFDMNVYAIYGALESYDFIPKPESTEYKDITPHHCNPNIYNKINNKTVFVLIQLNAGIFDLSLPPPRNATKAFKRIISCFIPSKKLRKKIRESK